MWATASTALRLQSSAFPPGAAPSAEPAAGILAPAADIDTAAVVPSTKVRREISGGSDTITSQRLTHAMHRTASIADHRHVRVVNREAFRATGGDEILARGRYQHTLVPESHHVGAHLHGVAVGNRYGTDPSRAQPLDEFRLDRFHAHDSQPFGDHAHLHVQMQEMRIECIGMELPTLGFEPALQLPYGGLDGTLTRVAASGDPWLQHHEVAAFDVARSDEIVNRDAGVEIELQAGGIL